MITRKGFSLIELLVVMVIIGILASMATLAYPRAIGIARRVACMSNLSRLRVLLQSTYQSERERREWVFDQTPFIKMYKWPGTVAAEAMNKEVFLCPEDTHAAYGNPPPPLEYKSGIHGGMIPFDPSHYSCCSREGVTESGERYTEYCIEECADIPSKFDHGPCCGVSAWSTNDGIWRVYHQTASGRYRVVLTFYTCTLRNELWIAGERECSLVRTSVPRTFWFDYAGTSYGYNAGLEGSHDVGEDTIVLVDYPDAYVDATDSQIYSDLNSENSRRHLGKHNVLYASGRVETVGTTSLYPTINMGQWTAARD